MMRKKNHIYNITLTNGELLENCCIRRPLEWNASGIAVNFVAMKDENGQTIVLSKYHIVKAELIRIEE